MTGEWREKPTQSVPETAKILGISRSLAFKMVHSGEIKSLKLGEKRRVVPTIAILRMIEQAAGE